MSAFLISLRFRYVLMGRVFEMYQWIAIFYVLMDNRIIWLIDNIIMYLMCNIIMYLTDNDIYIA
jgi:hypothetical protein